MKKPWPKYKDGTIQTVNNWKKMWKIAKKKETKAMLLASLVKSLAVITYQKPVKVKFDIDAPSCYYNKKTKTININKSLSIISTLHELAHHLYGPSELRACRWSIHLFRNVFPIGFKKLSWDGHMLKQKKHANKSRKLQSGNTKK